MTATKTTDRKDADPALAAARLEAGALLSPQECCLLGGFSLSSWNRNFRHDLPIVRLSSRRIGVWARDFHALLARRTEGSVNGASTPPVEA